MARPRFRRPPPPADPYAVEEIVVRRRDPRWIFVWLPAIGAFVALLIFIFVATRDNDDPAPARLVAVPRVLGADHVPAGATVEAAGLFADTFPVENNRPLGQVVAQAPPPGERVRAGTPVRLEVSRGPAAPGIALDVPNVTRLAAGDARALISRAGLTVRTIFREAPSGGARGQVLEQQPAAGASAAALDQVTLFVGR